MKRSTGNQKVKWVRKEISHRTKGKHLSRSQCANIMQDVWNEAHRKFPKK